MCLGSIIEQSTEHSFNVVIFSVGVATLKLQLQAPPHSTPFLSNRSKPV